MLCEEVSLFVTLRYDTETSSSCLVLLWYHYIFTGSWICSDVCYL